MKVAERGKSKAKAPARRPVLAPAPVPVPADEAVAPLAPPLPPGPDPRVKVTEEYARHVARDAFFWAWPMLDIYNRRLACTRVTEIARTGVLAAAPLNRLAMLTDFLPAPQRRVPCPDQDAMRGIGVLALDRSPVVIQVPDFGQRLWTCHLLDLRGDRSARLGRAHATRPGFYLLAGPGWNGIAPRGIAQVLRAPTATGLAAFRVFQDDTPEDNVAAQRVLGEIAMYPLAEYDGRVKRRDWNRLHDAPAGTVSAEEAPAVAPDRVVEQLAAVLAEAPPLRGEEARYAQVLALVAAARNDPRIHQAMVDGARDAHERIVKPLAQFRSHGEPLPHHWSTLAHAGAFGTDYFARTAAARSHLLSGAADEAKHFYLDLDASGERLNSAHRYTITFAKGAAPPVHAFWSLSIYDEQHFFVANSIDRFSVSSRSRDLRHAADGSLTAFVQSSMPTDPGQRPNWLPAPVGDFSLHLRAYWPMAATLDGTWTPPAVTRI